MSAVAALERGDHQDINHVERIVVAGDNDDSAAGCQHGQFRVADAEPHAVGGPNRERTKRLRLKRLRIRSVVMPSCARYARFIVIRNSAFDFTLDNRLVSSSTDSTGFMSVSTRRSL